MKTFRRYEELFLVLGLLFTQLIHCTWELGKSSVVMLILANNVGRCGLFLFVCFIGGYIWETKEKINIHIKIILVIYVLAFINNEFVDLLTGTYSGIKSTVLSFIRGTPGNIWILYGALLFSVLIQINEKMNISIPSWCRKIIGGYCIIAIFLFCYANVYSGFVSFDNGLIIRAFYKILGTNRSPYILAVPFLMLGAYIEKNCIYKEMSKYDIFKTITILLVWCIEVTFINRMTGNYNIHMTIVGAFSVYYIYAFLKSILYKKETGSVIKSKRLYLYLFLFGIQFSLDRVVVYFFNLDGIGGRIIWFLSYCLVTLIIIRIINSCGEKYGKKSIE